MDDVRTVPDLFRSKVKELGDRPCVAYKKGDAYHDITWNGMYTMIRRVASYLISIGIEKGDKVALFSDNRYEWWVIDQAVLAIGAIDVPIYATNSAAEAEYILRDSEAKVCFTGSEEHRDRVLQVMEGLPGLNQILIFDEPLRKVEGVRTLNEILMEAEKDMRDDEIDARIDAIDPEDLATYIYTSGTTGDPKGVMLSHHNFVSNVKQGTAAFEGYITPEDTLISFLPLSHSFERTVGYYLAAYNGAKVAFAESFQTILDDFKLVRPTIMISVPRLFEKIHAGIISQVNDAPATKKFIFNWSMKQAKKNVPYECTGMERKGLLKFTYSVADSLVFSKLKVALGLDRLRFSISGGGPLSVSDGEFFIGMGLKVYEGYGLTETTPVTNVNRPELIKTGTVGPALKDTEIRISDEGEIQIKGPQVMKGYYKRPQDTAEVMTDDCWFKTGDIGMIDEDGYLAITGRIKDIIVTAGGKNISPQNIENSIKASPFVEQIAIIGDKRKYLSALVVPNIEELKKWAAKNGIETNSTDELLKNNQVNELIQKEIADNTTQFARVEQIRRFTLLEAEWSQETGELTPKQSVKRRVIESKYATHIDAMYEDA